MVMADSRESFMFLEEFDFHKCLKLLVESHNSGDFGTALRRHLKDFVPAVFKNPREPDLTVENRLSQKLIFNLFDHFICGDVNPEDAYQELKKFESPSALCAKDFKLGEPTYSCRDCGMDPTCVLCVECFQHSAHRHHKYRMSTSTGGGYCDCGDSEAWKSEPFCDVHKPGSTHKSHDSSIDKLKKDMVARLENLFIHLTDYILEIILWPDPIDLPASLQCPVAPTGWLSIFITMLFNDEVHTYEQVTGALVKAIGCTQTTAIDLATTVDREGKSIVKIGSKTECETVKRIIEQATSRRTFNPGMEGTPLLVKIMSPFVVAHHSFAMKAIQWLRQLLNNYGVLRELYSEIALRPLKENDTSFVEQCMLNETQMWKSARLQTRQLFMTGIFMSPRLKKEFAVIYTKVYKSVVRSCVRDDHDHSFSVTSESVQIFTVPSLARMLITEQGLLKVILDALYEECSLKVKSNSTVMSFDGQESNVRFSRVYITIYDFKYALLIKPEPHEWTDKLRGNFLEGFEVFINILKLMQGMDANLRQVDAHIEYEQEWETGFNFQLRLVEAYSLLVDWCMSDSRVLEESIHILIKAIQSTANRNRCTETIRISGSTADCFRMDFTYDPVSIHTPLTRLLSSLLVGHNNSTNTLQLLETMMHEEKTSIKELLEPCLKAVVFVGQVNSGMWRRNGFSLQSQVYFYHNIKCRSTMFDKDLLFFQIATSIMPSNDFLLQLLHSFGLLNWSKSEYDTESTPDDSMKQVISLAETFLNWLINIYCERYTIGIGNVTFSDIQKYEVIHCLCIQPMSHSELLDAIFCLSNCEKERCLEEIVKEVATFKKPSSGLGKGLYELKDECYSMYNPHFYHYTKSNRAKSEENVKKYLKSKGLNAVIQPSSAPLPEFIGMFRNIPHLLDCDVFMHIVRLVLTRSTARWSKSWSEMQLEKVLFLMEYALREETSRRENGDTSFEFVRKAVDVSSSPLSIVQIMENLLAHKPYAPNSLRDMMSNIHERIIAMAEGGQTKMEEGSEVDGSSLSSAKEGRNLAKLSEKAKKRRDKIMAQMAKMQRSFIKENQELFESTSTNNITESSMDMSSFDERASVNAEVPMNYPVALGLKKSAAVTSICRQTCILCQEDQDVVHNDKALVYCCFIQKSSVLSTDRSTPLNIRVEQGTDPLFTAIDLNLGLHTSTCGHVMHADCWKSFYDALVQRETRRMPHNSFDVSKKEFLCPMCETISNAVLPLISPLPLVASKECEEKRVDLSLDEWLDGILKTVDNSIRQEKDRESRDESFFLVPCPLSTVTKMMAEGVAQRFQYIFDYMAYDNSSTFSDSIVDMLKKFSTDSFEESLDVSGDTDDNRVPITLWNTSSHTIMSIENCLRFEDKPLFGSLPSKQAECMGNLIRLSAVSCNFFPVEVIKKHCIRLLSVLVCRSVNPHDPNLMNFDLFHALVSICLSLPTLYREGDSSKTIVVPTGHVNESNLLKMVLACHLLQVFVAINDEDGEGNKYEGVPMETEESPNPAVVLLGICQHFRSLTGLPPTNMSSSLLQNHVQRSILPFLRCSSLFFHYLTGVPVPLKLFQINEDDNDDELGSICEYLDLPVDLASLFTKSKHLQSMITDWCQKLKVVPEGNVRGGHLGHQSTLFEGGLVNPFTKVKFPRKVNRLLELPTNYSDLINQSSMFTCPKSNSREESRTPALCLVCGKTVCSQSYCCQVKYGNSRFTIGAAMAHAYTCCGGVGLFLRVRDCQVMLIAGLDKACFMPSPYLDEYGETDEGLRRGNPLTLCQERYKHLERMWLNHSIAGELIHRVENPIHPQALMTAFDINHL